MKYFTTIAVFFYFLQSSGQAISPELFGQNFWYYGVASTSNFRTNVIGPSGATYIRIGGIFFNEPVGNYGGWSSYFPLVKTYIVDLKSVPNRNIQPIVQVPTGNPLNSSIYNATSISDLVDELCQNGPGNAINPTSWCNVFSIGNEPDKYSLTAQQIYNYHSTLVPAIKTAYSAAPGNMGGLQICYLP